MQQLFKVDTGSPRTQMFVTNNVQLQCTTRVYTLSLSLETTLNKYRNADPLVLILLTISEKAQCYISFTFWLTGVMVHMVITYRWTVNGSWNSFDFHTKQVQHMRVLLN